MVAYGRVSLSLITCGSCKMRTTFTVMQVVCPVLVYLLFLSRGEDLKEHMFAGVVGLSFMMIVVLQFLKNAA